MPNII